MRALIAFAMLTCLVGQAAAQAPAPPAAPATPEARPAQVERAVGPWELSNPAGDRKCDVMFKSERAGPGLALGFALACLATFPAIADIAAWNVTAEGNVLWLDRTGAVAFDFGETEVGIFEAIRPGDGAVYFLTNRGLAGTALPTAEEVVGTGMLGQPRGRAQCRLTFRPDLAASAGPLEQRFVLEVGDGCERAITTLGLTTWRLERELLVLQGGGGSLSFKRDPDGRWAKVPADGRPLVIQRD